ncbi:MAG: hypothetical protein ACYDAO_04610 [Thermoplasmataceae archaeon]
MNKLRMNLIFSDNEKTLENLRKCTEPEDKGMVQAIMNEGSLEYRFDSVKLTSIYSLADELMKAYDIVKKMEKVGE